MITIAIWGRLRTGETISTESVDRVSGLKKVLIEEGEVPSNEADP